MTGLFAWLSAMADSLSIIQFISRRFRKKLRAPNVITLDYWRLFGPSVPRIMELIEISPEVSNYGDFNLKFQINGQDQMIEKDIWKTYCMLMFRRNISVSRRLLWDKYVGDHDKSTYLDFLSKPSTDRAIIKWMDDNYIDESGDIERPNLESSYSYAGENEDDLGFLFVSVKNRSGNHLNTVRIKFLKSAVEQHLPKLKSPLLKKFTYDEIKEAFIDKGDPDHYLLKHVEASERDTIEILNWEPEKEFLFLLSIYRAGTDGLENGFLSDVYKLNSIEEKYGKGWQNCPIRGPSGELSIKEKVPYGWFRQ